MGEIIAAASAIAALIFSMKWGEEVERARLLLCYILVALLMLCVISAAGSAVDNLLTYFDLPKMKELAPLSRWELFWGVVGFYFSTVLVACAGVRYYLRVKGESEDKRIEQLRGFAIVCTTGPLILFLAWLSFVVHNHVCPGGC